MTTNSFKVRDDAGKTSDVTLHSPPIEAKTTLPVKANAISRYEKLGLTQEEAKALLKG